MQHQSTLHQSPLIKKNSLPLPIPSIPSTLTPSVRTYNTQIACIQNIELQKLRSLNKQLSVQNTELKLKTRNNLENDLSRSKGEIQRYKSDLVKFKELISTESEKHKMEIKEMKEEIEKGRNNQKIVEFEWKAKERSSVSEITNLKNQISILNRTQEIKEKNEQFEGSRLKREKETLQKNLDKTNELLQQEQETVLKLRSELVAGRKTENGNVETIRVLELTNQQLRKSEIKLSQQIESVRVTNSKLQEQIKASKEYNLQLESKLKLYLLDIQSLISIKQDILNQKLVIEQQLTILRESLNNQQKTTIQQNKMDVFENLRDERNSLILSLDQSRSENNELKIRLSTIMTQLNQKYNIELSNYRDKIIRMQIQIDKYRNKIQGKKQFDNILKVQIEETLKFKEIIQNKNDEIHQLHGVVAGIRAENGVVMGELNLEKVRGMFEVKSLKAQFEVEIGEVRNEVAVLKRVVKSLEERLGRVNGEVKMKDQFMKQVIVEKEGMSGESKEYIFEFFGYYEEMMQKIKQSYEQGLVAIQSILKENEGEENKESSEKIEVNVINK